MRQSEYPVRQAGFNGSPRSSSRAEVGATTRPVLDHSTVTATLFERTRPHLALIFVYMVAVLAATFIWFAPSELSREGRMVLIVMLLVVVGWTMTGIDDTSVAVGGILALIATGALEGKDLYRALGHELIWLLIAAFIMAAVLQASRIIEPLLVAVVSIGRSVSRLFYGLTAAIASTSLIIPSTSARASLLLPVFVLLARHIPSKRIVRALALLFPTVILLSAAGSLIGAGAHVLAAEVVGEKTGRSLDFLGWLILAMPIALLSSFGAAAIILHAFVPPALRKRRIQLPSVDSVPRTARNVSIMLALGGTIAMWMMQPVHGMQMGVVALAGAFAMLTAAGQMLKPKEAFKAVEVELIVFLAVAFALADAMIRTNVDDWLGGVVGQHVPALGRLHHGFVAFAVALIALLSHLVITSRTARAAVLIPAVVLPAAASGGDVTVLIMTAIVGTGLCQTMPASSKPVAIFARAPVPTFNNADLLRLSAFLLPMMLALIMVFALFVWPKF